MKVTGLPFKGAMVRALLREVQQPGTGKTQTRRIVKPQPVYGDVGDAFACWQFKAKGGTRLLYPNAADEIVKLCPYGAQGDLLYVRETMRVIQKAIRNDRVVAIRVRYEADGAESDWITWPERLIGNPETGQCLAYGGFREASRLTLLLKEVRVQQIQEISEEDAKAEGIKTVPFYPDDGFPLCDGYTHLKDDEKRYLHPHAKDAFRELWDSINGPRGYGFDKKPWVFALTFSVHLKNINDYMKEAA